MKAGHQTLLWIVVLGVVVLGGCGGGDVRDDEDRPPRPPIRRSEDAANLPKRPAEILRSGSRTVGRELYVLKCAGCHGTLGAPGEAPVLFDLDWSDERRVAAIQKTIVEGLGGDPESNPDAMPAFGNQLPAQQILDVMAWIATARAPNRPPGNTRRGR